ncbi:hypothetical protein EFO53_08280 [Lacticaseibacillus rhamnosus]|uniref:Uncharacterized protein n=1 Tax=Lacticaseibacillus rhamnosus TaxID=47715 RepID=A0AB74IG84_LACRH|nr:hypothetical protein [Lacticaseibacillus rhamnosus]MCT3150319.1 hypothetical protein [Lacticaseibacillus rhamnosus]MCT3157064.1 hypothetical protein [Lacticaseibacillus rhamnosus]MCT3157749.1 hypothetical protein [Lacticaseibacillus rhamnosus]MCT3187502.1 hypothetical protein [Lacticaseibacillus rhamnosus]
MTRSPAQKSECKKPSRNVKTRPSRPKPLTTLRLLSTLAHAHKTQNPPKSRQRWVFNDISSK